MNNTPYERIEKCWPHMTRGDQLRLEAEMLAFATLYRMRGAIMEPTNRRPLYILILVSVLYSAFALLLFKQIPEIIFIAGFILGGVWVSVFIITLFTGGRKK